MSMPPSGVDGSMDDEAVIEAQIQLELENINLDDDILLEEDFDDNVDENANFDLQDGDIIDVPNELDNYIKTIQDQTNRFEKELLECDTILNHTSTTDVGNQALIPYDDQTLLVQLAKERGCTVEEYKIQILEEIENDEVVIEDELADLIEEIPVVVGSNNAVNSELKAITENGETTGEVIDNTKGKMEVEIRKALEEGIDPDEVPVSQDLVPVNGQTPQSAEIQRMLRNQLEKLEMRYQERIDKIKKDEAYRRDVEDVRDRRVEEERLWKRQEIERQEKTLTLEREAAQKEMERQEEKVMEEIQASRKKFEEDMAVLQAETERQKKEHELALEEERKRQIDRQEKAAVRIQRMFRGYRVRKEVGPSLSEKKETRRQQREKERIKEVEIEIEQRKEEQKVLEEQQRAKEEEEKRLKEEEKQQKELEKKQKEEEKHRLKEEEERKKQEEKKRKEEEKQRKKEEEKMRKEEEKKRKLEEEQRKKEEKRMKEEEEKRKKEELKHQKEEEKRRMEEETKQKKEEEKRKREEAEERKREEERLAKDAKQKEKEQNSITKTGPESQEGDEKDLREGEVLDNNRNKQEKEITKASCSDDTGAKVSKEVYASSHVQNQEEGINGETVTTKDEHGIKAVSQTSANIVKQNVQVESSSPKTPRPKTPRAKTPRAKTPRSARKQKEEGQTSAVSGEAKEPTKVENADCLPEPLEKLRLQFIKDCLPWSKVANEPWKLKAGVSKKPLRRPSSAKKLPLLSENIIIQAGRVASLKQVTTVQLSDLPGNNVSSLGQCWGLKYLALNNCNLVAVDGLGQCKQLQYLDIRNNKLEFLDVKDIGQLQYVNASHNRMSSIHGLDNCTNLRWLDMSHNNITRLGGMETLRRVCTLKMSHNQLITTQGLGDTPTLQMIDISYNHLQSLEDVDKLCLLESLDMSSNNLLKVPKLTNQVLLQELLLSDNSISCLEELASTWLPLLNKLVLCQNSIEELPVLDNCLLLKKLDLNNNQLLDPDVVHRCVEKCVYLEILNVQENPVTGDMNESFYQKLHHVCPRLQTDQRSSSSPSPIKPRTSFEMMCLTQCQTVRDIATHFDNSLKSILSKGQPVDLAQLSDIHFKFCEKMFNTMVEFRYAHEYGEVAVTVPTAPKMPKSGRPLSSRQKDKFMSPKDLFENALKAPSQASAGKAEHDAAKSNSYVAEPTNALTQSSSNPRDLFEEALKSAGKPKVSSETSCQPSPIMNGYGHGRVEHESSPNSKTVKAATTIQAYWRGWLVRHEIREQTRIWLAATTIQAVWRGYRVRQITLPEIARRRQATEVNSEVIEQLHTAATKIQATWRGYILRKKLLAALEYAQYDWSDEEDHDAMNLNDEFDVDKFLDFDENQLDSEWKPPETPDIPVSHAVLRKPPSGKARVPPINTGDHHPPSNPRRAWKNLESPMSDYDKVPRPPSSLASTNLTARTAMSKKEEKLSEEWGFKDSSTAHLMMQRAKKMKYNSEKRKKLSKLDPKQRLALFRKLEEVTHQPTVPVPQRKTLPRKEYFQARQEEINRQEVEKREEFHTKVSRTFEWLHTQVGDHPITDSVINQNVPRYVTDQNLPVLQGGRRVQLVSSPCSLELQSVDSVSSAGHKGRRFSVGSGGPPSKLPPILQTSSAPTQHAKERMSFRNPKNKNPEIGWGSGRKRTNKF